MTYAWLIPALPAASFIILLFLGKRFGKWSHFVSVGAILSAFAISSFILYQVIGGRGSEVLIPWLSIGELDLNVGILIDRLTAVMLMVVTSVASLVQIYSVGYMKEDRRYHWYFACLSLFTAAMLMLVLSANYVQMYASWELVGLCSYLLIGFWFEKKAAADAAKKAFVTTRIGDVGFLLGLVVLYYAVGNLDVGSVLAARLAPAVATAASLLLFLGAMGKSAQFPLHVWLPDAMEGPTPVSALIHAATMVAAGVYLVARSYPIFAASGVAMDVVAGIGAVTALMAATIALVQRDIKRILAYSTISQLGLMMIGLGVGAYSAAVFHLTTHAFFKALLFLGAGSVIHSAHTQDIFEMGGLAKKMKGTAFTFAVGGLALAGFPGLSGFWSKEGILTAAFVKGAYPVFAAALLTSLLTAFYVGRLYFVVFTGSMRKNMQAKVHESPLAMVAPLAVLAFPAGLVGLIGSPLFGNAFQGFLRLGESGEHVNLMVMGLSIAVALAGLGFAWIKYSTGLLPSGLIKTSNPFFLLLKNKYYLDEIYTRGLVAPVVGGSRALFSFDSGVVDGAVNGTAWLTSKAGDLVRRAQRGQIQDYGLVMVLGIIVLIFWMLTFARL
ncbi:MAG: NADH-quinone oxidoreductase subunit L [Actinobacteria bacterium]|nr:NADH-quinone oxidoreductase subunit L [Actinomycetota bacterium]